MRPAGHCWLAGRLLRNDWCDLQRQAEQDNLRKGGQPVAVKKTLAVAVTALCVASCSTKSTSTADSRYTQTWPKSYSSTTCQEWAATMTEQQKFAAAADMLTSARNKGDGGKGVPPDALITYFQSGISNVCPTAPSMSLAETGATLYLTERTKLRPN